MVGKDIWQGNWCGNEHAQVSQNIEALLDPLGRLNKNYLAQVAPRDLR